MATLVITKADPKEFKAQGIKHAQNIEWVKVVASSSTTGQGAAYSYTEVKNVVGIIGGGPLSNAIDNSAKTVTFTPVATCSGTFFIGLLGPIL